MKPDANEPVIPVLGQLELALSSCMLEVYFHSCCVPQALVELPEHILGLMFFKLANSECRLPERC